MSEPEKTFNKIHAYNKSGKTMCGTKTETMELVPLQPITCFTCNRKFQNSTMSPEERAKVPLFATTARPKPIDLIERAILLKYEANKRRLDRSVAVLETLIKTMKDEIDEEETYFPGGA